jgi:hypothetical protein
MSSPSSAGNLTPLRRSPELASNCGCSTRTRFQRDSFGEQCMAIIEDAQTVILAVQDLSLEPTSRTTCTRLKVAGRELKRRCNRLAYKLGRKAAKS